MTVKVNVELTEEQMARLVRKHELLAELKEIQLADQLDNLIYLTSPIAKMMDNALYAIEGFIKKTHERILNSKMIMRSIDRVIETSYYAMMALSEITRQKVRLYAMEGQHLSRKDDEDGKRMTWYTSPSTAKDVGDQLGNLTGRIVYIDITLDYGCDFTYRFYKRGDVAYVLRGDLIKVAKRNWKYLKEVV